MAEESPGRAPPGWSLGWNPMGPATPDRAGAAPRPLWHTRALLTAGRAGAGRVSPVTAAEGVSRSRVTPFAGVMPSVTPLAGAALGPLRWASRRPRPPVFPTPRTPLPALPVTPPPPPSCRHHRAKRGPLHARHDRHRQPGSKRPTILARTALETPLYIYPGCDTIQFRHASLCNKPAGRGASDMPFGEREEQKS